MHVYCYPADHTACGFYRLREPARVLAAAGHDVRIVAPNARTGDVALRGMQDQHGIVRSVEVPPDADVIVLQRVTLIKLAQAIPLIRAQGVAVVVDMDDDLTSIDPRNAAWTSMHPRRGQDGHSWEAATQACLAATLVTVSTPALLRTYAPHGRGVVLDNYVPEAYLNVGHVDSDVIGWPGSVHSHPGDLQTVGPAVARVVREGGRPFLNVGDGVGVRAALSLGADPEATGVVELGDWPAAVSRIGVGVAPLADTVFNRAKSRLKILEMSAVGVPWIASPRAEYQALHKLGCGVLADKPKDWYRQLRALAGDPGRRADLSAAGRAVATTQTIEEHAWRWLTAWEQARAAQGVRPRQAAVSVFTRG